MTIQADDIEATVEQGSMQFPGYPVRWSESQEPLPADPWAKWRRAAKIALLLAIPVLILLGFVFLGGPASSAAGGCGGG